MQEEIGAAHRWPDPRSPGLGTRGSSSEPSRELLQGSWWPFPPQGLLCPGLCWAKGLGAALPGPTHVEQAWISAASGPGRLVCREGRALTINEVISRVCSSLCLSGLSHCIQH